MIAITGSQTGFLSSKLLAAIPDSVSIPRPTRKEFFSLTQWLLERRPKCVIHCAGLADVRMCMQYPREAFRVNTVDTITLVEALGGSGIPLIYVATDKVFGNQQWCVTTTPYQPSSPYDISKVAAEMVIEEFAKKNQCIIARFPNFFGPGDPHKERLFPSVVEATKSKQKTFIVRTKSSNVRQYIFIDDVVDILIDLAAFNTRKLKHHFGSPHLKSVHQVIENLCDLFEWHMQIEEQDLAGEASHLSIATDTDISFKSHTTWDQALRSFL